MNYRFVAGFVLPVWLRCKCTKGGIMLDGFGEE